MTSAPDAGKQRDGSLGAIAALWGIATLALIGMWLAGTEPQVRLYYSNAMQTLTSLGCGVISVATMRMFPPGSPLRSAWALIGLAALAWGAAAAVFALYPLLNNGEDTPYPYFSDVGYLLTSLLVAIGLWVFKRGCELSAPLWGKLLAVLVFLASLYWSYLANREGLASGSLPLSIASAGYLLFDPLLLAVTVLVASSIRSGTVGAAWSMVLVGVLLFYAANQAYAYLMLQDAYRTGHWIDTGWMSAFGLIALAGIHTRNLMR